MPGLVRKLLIFAAVDGVLLQPVNQRGSENAGIHIAYGAANKITSTPTRREGTENSLEAHGIIGLLQLVSSSYLVTITRREQVAQIREKPIFRITDVTLIPLRSKAEADKAITEAQRVLGQHSANQALDQSDDSDVGDDAETSTIGSVDTVDQPAQPQKAEPEDEAAALEPPKGGAIQKSTTFVKDVVQEKGKYGRFASRWFSRNGSKEGVKRQQGVAVEEQDTTLTKEQEEQMDNTLPQKEAETNTYKDVQAEHKVEPSNSKPKQQSAIEHLTPRILKSARLYFSSSGFYFSYNHDLSTSLARSRVSSGPLWKRFDPLVC